MSFILWATILYSRFIVSMVCPSCDNRDFIIFTFDATPCQTTSKSLYFNNYSKVEAELLSWTNTDFYANFKILLENVSFERVKRCIFFIDLIWLSDLQLIAYGICHAMALDAKIATPYKLSKVQKLMTVYFISSREKELYYLWSILKILLQCK